jgi:hypothetical protein
MQMALYKEVRQGRDELLQQMREGRPANVDGYAITASMYEQVTAVDLVAGEKRSDLQCLIAHVAPHLPAALSKELSQLVSRYPHGEAVLAAEDPFWKEIKAMYALARNLSAETLGWLGRGGHAH